MAHTLLKLLAVLAPVTVAAAACGGSSSGGTGGSGGTSSHTTTTTSTTTTTTSTTTSTSTTTTTTTSTGTGGAPGGSCTNAADEMILGTQDVPTIAANCAKANLGNDAATGMCIQMDTNLDGGGPGLSNACTMCFVADIDCTINHCLSQCLSDPSSAPCVMCRAQNCDPAFYACSGLTPPDGG